MTGKAQSDRGAQNNPEHAAEKPAEQPDTDTVRTGAKQTDAEQTDPDSRDRAERARILDDALALTAEAGWHGMTFRALSEKTGHPLHVLYTHFESKRALLSAYEKSLNAQVLRRACAAQATERPETPDTADSADAQDTPDMLPPRDRLFDALMERFDLMNADRDALCAIARAAPGDPSSVAGGLPQLAASMRWMLICADIETNGLRGALKVAALTGIYLKTVRVWLEDDSPDLGATMAALDSALSRAETLAGRLGM